jgi:hypothetical protein
MPKQMQFAGTGARNSEAGRGEVPGANCGPGRYNRASAVWLIGRSAASAFG